MRVLSWRSGHAPVQWHHRIEDGDRAIACFKFFGVFYWMPLRQGDRGLPVNEATVTLERVDVSVPDALPIWNEEIVPFHAGETLGWRLVD